MKLEIIGMKVLWSIIMLGFIMFSILHGYFVVTHQYKSIPETNLATTTMNSMGNTSNLMWLIDLVVGIGAIVILWMVWFTDMIERNFSNPITAKPTKAV